MKKRSGKKDRAIETKLSFEEIYKQVTRQISITCVQAWMNHHGVLYRDSVAGMVPPSQTVIQKMVEVKIRHYVKEVYPEKENYSVVEACFDFQEKSEYECFFGIVIRLNEAKTTVSIDFVLLFNIEDDEETYQISYNDELAEIAKSN